MSKKKQLPLRSGVGIILLNHKNKVFVGKNKEINVKTKNPEFLDWKWIDISKLSSIAVSFKIELYKRLEKELNFLKLN